MIPLGLRAADLRAYQEQLATDHSVHVRVVLMTLDHDPVDDVTDRLLDGQVDISWASSPSRAARLDLFDPGHGLRFDTASPAEGQVYADRMVRLIHSTWVDTLGDWVSVPIFTGPIVRADRAGDVLTLECHGKETLAQRPAWEVRTWAKGHNKVETIRAMMAHMTGERYWTLPDWGYRLAHDVTVGRDRSDVWTKVQALAGSMDAQLFYDGRGVMRLRRKPRLPVFYFSVGTGGTVLSDPQVKFDSIDQVVNTVWVVGSTPKGAKRQVEATHYAPHNHPLSPWRLGRTNWSGEHVSRYLYEKVEDSTIRSLREAHTVARNKLARHLDEHVQATFDALPVPHLEEGDMCGLHTDDGHLRFRLQEASIPLSHSGAMSVGARRRVHRAPIRKG